MRQQLSKLMIRAVMLTVVMLVADRIIGYGLEQLFYKQTHGDDYTTLYALDKATDDVLIFGTSRASHHYNAAIVSQQTGMTCFNAGRDEMEIPYTEALLQVINKRHQPKLVILDIGPIELAGDKQIVYERIAASLMPFYNKYPMLQGTISKAGAMEMFKIRASKIYAYNSKIGSAIQNSYTNMGHSSVQGYEPLYKTIDTAVYKESIWANMNKNLPVSEDYLATLDNIIAITKANNTRLVVVISPFYFHNDFSKNDSYNTIKSKVAAHPDVLLLDFSNDPQFTGQPLLFNDDVHLNDSGAGIYTRKVVTLIQQAGLL